MIMKIEHVYFLSADTAGFEASASICGTSIHMNIQVLDLAGDGGESINFQYAPSKKPA